MADAWMNRMGGNSMMWGGLLWVVARLVHPVGTTLEELAAVNTMLWSVVHWAFLVGNVLIIAGLFMLVRHLAAKGAGESVGWGTLALAFGVVGFTLDSASTAIHLLAFPPLVADMTAAGAQATFEAAGAVNASTGSAGFAMASVGLVMLGLVARREGWPSWLGLGALVVGLAQVVLLLATSGGVTLLPPGLVTSVVNALMPASFAAAGWAFAGSARTAGAAA